MKDDDYITPPLYTDRTNLSVKVGNDKKKTVTPQGKIVYAIMAILASVAAIALSAVIMIMHLDYHFFWVVVGAVAAAFSAAHNLRS